MRPHLSNITYLFHYLTTVFHLMFLFSMVTLNKANLPV